MKKLDSYKLPAPIAFALSTGRVELLRAITIQPDTLTELVRLLADLLNDRQEMGSRVEQLRQAVEMTAQTNEGQMRKLEFLMSAVVEQQR